MSLDKKDVTIYDLAAKLKVSVATVSRALRDDPVVSLKTRKKVFALAEQYGYQANHFARSLRNKQTHTIGVIVPRLNSYFMATVIAGIEQAANQAGYNLLISQSSESPEKEKAIVNTMFHNRVDGLLVSLAYQNGSLEHLAKFTKKNIPVVFFDRAQGADQYTSVQINNRQAGYEATRHLLSRGKRNIFHITVSTMHSLYRQRYEGYVQALREFGLAPDPDLIFLSDLSQESGFEAARHILSMSKRPDGIFVANDNCAVGCLVSLQQKGIRIPEDIAVVGFNDDPVCKIVSPNLTTIHYPGHLMGEQAARHLIHHLNGSADIALTQSILLRSDLVVRQST